MLLKSSNSSKKWEREEEEGNTHVVLWVVALASEVASRAVGCRFRGGLLLRALLSHATFRDRSVQMHATSKEDRSPKERSRRGTDTVAAFEKRRSVQTTTGKL